MTNFESITKDENTLANWLCDRMDCHMCPVWGECFYNDDKPRTRYIYEWLKSQANSEVDE